MVQLVQVEEDTICMNAVNDVEYLPKVSCGLGEIITSFFFCNLRRVMVAET